jgi:hypothetical protein
MVWLRAIRAEMLTMLRSRGIDPDPRTPRGGHAARAGRRGLAGACQSPRRGFWHPTAGLSSRPLKRPPIASVAKPAGIRVTSVCARLLFPVQ